MICGKVKLNRRVLSIAERRKKKMKKKRVGGTRVSRIGLQSRDSTWSLPIRGPHADADVVEGCARKLKLER